MIGVKEAKHGIRKVGPVVVLVGAGIGNPLPVYQISNVAATVGVKTCKLKKVTITDTTAGGTVVHFGTGVAGAIVDIIPPMVTVAGLPVVQDWDDTDGPEFGAGVPVPAVGDLMAWAVAVQVEVQVEVDEIG